MSKKIAFLFYRSHTCKFRCTRFVLSTKVSMIYTKRDLHKKKSTRRYILISIKCWSLGCNWLLSNNIWLCLCYHVDLIRLVYSCSSIKWNSSNVHSPILYTFQVLNVVVDVSGLITSSLNARLFVVSSLMILIWNDSMFHKLMF